MNRRVMVGLLEKASVQYSPKDALRRLERKTRKLVDGGALPDGLTDEEKALVAELQSAVESTPPKQQASVDAKKAGKSKRIGCEIFRSLFSPGETVLRADVLDRLIKSGIKPATVSSYIAWAKRPIENKVKNPFGFRLVAGKDEQGRKVLKLV